MPPTVSVPALAVTVRLAPRVTPPVPRFKSLVPVKVKLPFQASALLVESVMAAPLGLAWGPREMVNAAVRVGEAFLILGVRALRVVPPLLVLAPESVRVPVPVLVITPVPANCPAVAMTRVNVGSTLIAPPPE